MKSSMRSATIGTATAAVALTGLAVAPAAHADNVQCPFEQTTSKFFGDCTRNADDEDAGGVSGSAGIVRYSAYDVEAWAEFYAKTEEFDVFNNLDRKMRFKLQWKDSSGEIHTAVSKVVAAGDSKSWNLSLPEGVRVGVAVSSTSTGLAGINTFRA